jgi:hypothetical protein
VAISVNADGEEEGLDEPALAYVDPFSKTLKRYSRPKD